MAVLMVTLLWAGAWNGLPLNTYISMYARTNRCYNERGSRTNYVRSSISHGISCFTDVLLAPCTLVRSVCCVTKCTVYKH